MDVFKATILMMMKLGQVNRIAILSSEDIEFWKDCRWGAGNGSRTEASWTWSVKPLALFTPGWPIFCILYKPQVIQSLPAHPNSHIVLWPLAYTGSWLDKIFKVLTLLTYPFMVLASLSQTQPILQVKDLHTLPILASNVH